MTDPSHQLPVGACGDVAPTGDPAYQVGYQSVQIGEAIRTITTLIKAIDGEDPWELAHARDFAARSLDYLKDRP